MLSVRLDSNLEERLNSLVEITQRPKSFFVKEALSNYLDDMQDYYEAQKRSKSEDKNLISLDELEKFLEL
jgi:RHH-type rel operon transcriptional repressor/antitoxin RelB